MVKGAARWILLTTMTGAAALAGVAGSSVSPRFFAPATHPPIVARGAARADMARQSSRIDVAPDRDGTDDSDTDLYGNDVTDAVATYQLDAAGSLYETHSPRTELPRLKPPRG
jgi:hypothetical protein